MRRATRMRIGCGYCRSTNAPREEEEGKEDPARCWHLWSINRRPLQRRPVSVDERPSLLFPSGHSPYFSSSHSRFSSPSFPPLPQCFSYFISASHHGHKTFTQRSHSLALFPACCVPGNFVPPFAPLKHSATTPQPHPATHSSSFDTTPFAKTTQ